MCIRLLRLSGSLTGYVQHAKHNMPVSGECSNFQVIVHDYKASTGSVRRKKRLYHPPRPSRRKE